MERRAWWRGLAFLVLIAAGMLVVTSARLADGTDLRAERRTELADLILAEEARVSAATGQVEQLRAQVQQLSGQVDDSRQHDRRLLAGRAAAAAGLTEVVGEGLEVRLTDAPVPAAGIPDEFAADDYVVHQSDVQAVVNALWAGGAEAIGVMDQRIISTSAVRCVGNTLILGGRVYSPPYTVAAVGRTDRMARALDAAPGVVLYRQYADLIGLGYAVEASQSLVIPAYQGPLELRHAQVAP